QDTLAMTLGGRAAEEIVFGEITTGAATALEKVTATAKQMVMRFGMSEKLGPRVFVHGHGQPVLGPVFSRKPHSSPGAARETEADVFGAEAPPPPQVPIPGTPVGERREGPRPLPRPGLAGGTAE